MTRPLKFFLFNENETNMSKKIKDPDRIIFCSTCGDTYSYDSGFGYCKECLKVCNHCHEERRNHIGINAHWVCTTSVFLNYD